MLLQLAFRNIWRNKRRTLITIGAVCFAVFLASFMSSFQKGAWDSIIDGSVNQYFGFAQIHKNGYWNDQSIDNSILFDEQLKALPQKSAFIETVIPRLESFALASEGELTAGVLVLGIQPEAENSMTAMAEKIIEGSFLTDTDNAVIVASGLAKKLGLSINDTLVLISQGYHGANAAGKFPIKGIFEFGLPDLNKRLVGMPLLKAQEFYNAPGRVSSIALKIADKKMVPLAIAHVKKNLTPIEDFEIMSWEELIPALVQARQLDTAAGGIILGILYLLITFAIFGTILMMTKERSYEFGVLTAIGMGRWKLFGVIWLETIVVGLIGALLGILLSIPIIYYLHINPIHVSMLGEEAAVVYEKYGIAGTLPTTFEMAIFFKQAMIIFVVTCLLAIYPLINIMRLQPVSAMRDN